ncbi:hypothetical protein [Thermogemmatispora sp.]|uniref:hypothetical protein n=1 Tax=Thermogemmatispora sp. TaxID=1968838 RepID=UPI001E198D4F|nr:hypothetical protein [Thermogemmatispora sp.]MBX5450456.1 hypothetical protein [Thermogemmatispora sp.]
MADLTVVKADLTQKKKTGDSQTPVLVIEAIQITGMINVPAKGAERQYQRRA